ncbi:MAG: hypothetical protein EOO13_09285 [Chitinophagaceae bacterium]|nr:MAG: hypothetical protein EOO13_09285 [Chitinophagaceae bacterium]
MKLLFLATLFFISGKGFSQVGIGTNTPNNAAVLDISATDKGLLIPRVALVDPNLASPLSAHVAGMLVYNTNTNGKVTPGFYMNNGTSWIGLSTAISKIDSLNEAVNAGTVIKRAVFIAGQSNTHFGYGNSQNFPDITGKKLSQLGRGASNLQVLPLTFYGTAQHTVQNDKISFGTIFLSRYYDSLQLKYPGRKIELLLVPCGAASSGWNDSQYPGNSWRTDELYFKDLTERIKWVMNNGYQIDAVLWHQGETDALGNTYNYNDLLRNFIQSIRDFAGNDKLPFITGELLQSWVASNAPNSVNMQNNIDQLGNEIPYTYTVSSNGLSSFDPIHFDADAHVELGKRYLNALPLAKLNSNPLGYIAVTPGQYLVLNHNGSATFSTIFQAIRNGSSESDNLYSRLGDIWKYKNADGYYHFKLEIVNGGSITGGIFEWKQKFNPFGLRENDFEDKAACIILANTINLDLNSPTSQGFKSLVYDSPANTASPTTLFHADNRTSNYYWFSIGLIQPFSGRIPIIESNNIVSQIKLYMIKQ